MECIEKILSFGIVDLFSIYIVVTAMKVPLDERALKTDVETLLTVYRNDCTMPA